MLKWAYNRKHKNFVFKYVFGVVLAITLAPLIAFGGPGGVEAALFPITTKTDIIVTKNNEKEVCFSLEFTKLRTATPKFFTWIYTDENNVRFYLITRRVAGDWTARFNANSFAPANTRIFIENCATKPDGIRGLNFTLEVYTLYRTFHDLWDVPRKFPTIRWNKGILEKKTT